MRAIPYADFPKPTALVGVDSGGKQAVVSDGDLYFLWKSDGNVLFDLGQGDPNQGGADPSLLAFSPDGRYVAYPRAKDGVSSLILFDTQTLTEHVIAPVVDQGLGTVARFTDDSRWIIAHGREKSTDTASGLFAVDLRTNSRVTLVQDWTVAAADAFWLTRGNHVVFCDRDPNAPSNTPTPVKSFELGTGTSVDLGTVDPGQDRPVVLSSDGSYVVLVDDKGTVKLFEDAGAKLATIGKIVEHDGDYAGAIFSGLMTSPDGRWISFVDAVGNFFVYDVKSHTKKTLADGGGVFAPSAPGVATRPSLRSAAFLADGTSLVHPLMATSTSGGRDLVGVGRYDLIAQTERTQAPPLEAAHLMAVGPTGTVLLAGFGDQGWLYDWQSPPVSLTAHATSGTYLFTGDGRYLLYFWGNVTYRNLSTGTTTPRGTSSAFMVVPWWINPETGAIATPNSEPPSFFAPDAPPVTLGSRGTILRANATRSVAMFTDQGTALLLRLESNGTPRAIGNGDSLGFSARYAFFRDLDGVVAAPY